MLAQILLLERSHDLCRHLDIYHTVALSFNHQSNGHGLACITFVKLTMKKPLKSKKELQTFLGIMNYLSNFSLARAEGCVLLCRLPFIKTEWTWGRKYQDLFDRVKVLFKETPA